MVDQNLSCKKKNKGYVIHISIIDRTTKLNFLQTWKKKNHLKISRD